MDGLAAEQRHVHPEGGYQVCEVWLKRKVACKKYDIANDTLFEKERRSCGGPPQATARVWSEVSCEKPAIHTILIL